MWLGAAFGALTPQLLLAQVVTPEQAANGTGIVPNSYYSVTYNGQVTPGNYYAGTMQPGYYPSHPSLAWYKYVSDGVTAVSFDMVGTDISFGGAGTFSGSNGAELAVYDSNGHFVAGNQGVRTPAQGDSNVAYTIPTGAPNPPEKDYFSQPLDPTQATAHYSDQWYNDNQAGLPTLTFTNSAQPDPQWNPASSTFTPATSNTTLSSATADWDQHSVLPAGTYFIAVAGYSSYFAGDPHDITTTPGYTSFNDTANPFGFVDYSAFGGTYQLNVRLAGDINNDNAVNTTDLNDLIAEIQTLAPYNGIDPDGFYNGTWVGLPYNLTTYDLTGNSRIDKYDLLTFERLTGIYAPMTTQNVATLTGSSTMTIDSTLLVVTNGGTYSGVLQDVVLPGALQLNGGTLTLSGNNTYSGGTTINGGTLSVSTEANLGDPYSNVTLNGGTLQITGTAYAQTNRNFLIGVNGGTINMVDPASNLTLTAPISIAGTFTKSGAGTLTISENVNTTFPIIISGGNFTLENYTNSTAGISGAGTLSVLANTTLVSDAITTGGLTVAGSVQIRSNGSSTSKVSSLSVTGSLDLTNNSLILETTPATKATAVATLQSEIAAGAGLTTGIFSSTLPANEALAVVDNSLLATPKTTYKGASVDTSSIIVTAALLGDANIDGKVDLSDLNIVLNNLGSTTTAWALGNFDHAATIDLTDLNDVLNHLGTSLPAGVAATDGGGASAVPEPASLSILGSAAATLMLARRKR
jgi:autotransporter-associated beta strand protein